MNINHFNIRQLTQDDLAAAAKIHAASFDTAWDADALADYLMPNAVCLALEESGALGGFILLGPCTDQTDIITLAVAPQMRGKGRGRALVAAAEAQARLRGVELIFLEVAQDNIAASALYTSCGYVPIGTRKNYYRRAGGRVNARTMRKDLS